MKAREANFDLLRIICTVAVILIHVSSDFVAASFAYNITEDGVFSGNLLLSFLLDTIPRFAVPCFVMLSGGFILADKRNTDFKYFYGKSLRNVGAQAIIFSLGYTLYGIIKRIMRIRMEDGSLSSLFYPIYLLLIGKPFFHMWYLFMLMMLYLMTPLILILEDGLRRRGKKPWGGVFWAFLLLSSLSYWTSTYTMGWDVGVAFCYLSYFLMGYVIREWSIGRKNSFQGCCLVALGLIILLFLGMMRYKLASSGVTIQQGGDVVVAGNKLEIFAYEGLDPFVVGASILIFAGFSLMKIRGSGIITKISSLTFSIYLFHGGVWDILKAVLKGKGFLILQRNFAIPFCVILVLLFSFVLAIIYRYIWDVVDQHCRISKRISERFQLDQSA